MQNKSNNDLKELEPQIDDEQFLIIAKYTYEHVKVKEEEEQ